MPGKRSIFKVRSADITFANRSDLYLSYKMSGTIWIQTVWHSDGFLTKLIFIKNQQTSENVQNNPSCKELKKIFNNFNCLLQPVNISSVIPEIASLTGALQKLNPKSTTYNLQQMAISNFAAFSKITNKA